MAKAFTCGRCTYLVVSLNHNAPMARCGRTSDIVPYEYENMVYTFKRVPTECPLLNGVHKSSKPAHPATWVTISL